MMRDEAGLAMFAMMLLLLILLSLGSASLLQSTIDLKGAAHYRSGNEALASSESGIVHALSTINQRMVMHFGNNIVDQWDSHPTLLGSNWTHMDGGGTADQYQVTVERFAANPGEMGWILAQGRGPLSAERGVRVLVRRRLAFESPGAIYFYNDQQLEAQWMGNSFMIDGRDYDGQGNRGDPARDVPALSARNDGNTEELTNQMNSGQHDNTCGLGNDCNNPPVDGPSIMTSTGPNVDDVDQIVNDILNSTPACPEGVALPTCVVERNDSHLNGADIAIGTPAQPAIIHLTNPGGVRINGNWTGYGIIISDGPIDFNGTAEFYGWVIARGGGVRSSLNGTADIHGTLWTETTDTRIGGNLNVNYCTDCLALASRSGLGGIGQNFPRRMEVVAWYEN